MKWNTPKICPKDCKHRRIIEKDGKLYTCHSFCKQYKEFTKLLKEQKDEYLFVERKKK